MSETSRKCLLELLQLEGNNECADCKSNNGVTWASYNIGVFLCKGCADVHKSLGSHISKTKSIEDDTWTQEHLEFMASVGNLKAAQRYQQHVPVSYRVPHERDVKVLKEEWIRSKYVRDEFSDPNNQSCISRVKEGYLWKKGRDDTKFQKRRFVLSEDNDTLLYYNKENAKEPKCIMRLEELNVTFVPDKVGNMNAIQITFGQEDKTRNLFVYAELGKDIVDWYNAIRCAKLNRLQIAFPKATESDLLKCLTRDFVKEGWLHKTGPTGKGYKKRWFTLDKRRLMYHETPLDAFPKGEVYIGHKDQGFNVIKGIKPGMQDFEHGYTFTLKTHQKRDYLFAAETENECDDWMLALKKVIDAPLTPQESLESVRRR